MLGLTACIVASTRIRTESNVLKFFPATSRITRDYAFIGQKLTGFYTVELDVRTPLPEEAAALVATRRFGDEIAARPEVARVDSFASLTSHFQDVVAARGILGASAKGLQLFTDMSRRFRGVFPHGPAGLNARHAGLPMGKNIRQTDSDVSLRVSVLVRAMSSSDFYSLLKFIREKARATLPPSATLSVTGLVSLLNDAQRSLVQTQVESFGLAAAVVFVMIGAFFRSVRAGLASILPNIMPIFGAFALMGVGGIPLDSATVMTASIAIGIGVDNTIHFLARYRDGRAAGLAHAAAAALTLQTTGSAMLFTSVVAAAGFGVLCLAQFKPICYFGLLAGVTMITALLADLIVTPACACLFRVWEKK